MIKEILLGPWAIGVYVTLGLGLIGKIIPDKNLRAWGESIADWLDKKAVEDAARLTKFMVARVGKKAWEKIESFFQSCGLQFVGGLWKHGPPYFGRLYKELDKDDQEEKNV